MLFRSDDAGMPEIGGSFGLFVVVLILLSCVCGVFCISVTITELNIFYSYFNYTTEWTKFFSAAAYTVYLIHPWVITPVAWTWIWICRAAGQVKSRPYAAHVPVHPPDR